MQKFPLRVVLEQGRERYKVARAVGWAGGGCDHVPPPSLHQTARGGSPRKPEDKPRTNSAGGRDELQPCHRAASPSSATDRKSLYVSHRTTSGQAGDMGNSRPRPLGAVSMEAARLA